MNDFEPLENPNESLLLLDKYRKSPQPSAGASRPKRVFTSPKGEVYFKFDIAPGEVCAELFAYYVAKHMNVPVAETQLAESAGKIGVASFDIGEYEEPDDSDSYSIKDYIHIDGFIQMCLLDYVIMNEDRHAGNWGIADNKVAPLFDHNYCFGGEDKAIDINNFMAALTSPFNVNTQYEQRHDSILEYMVKNHKDDVSDFMMKVETLANIENSLWIKYFPEDYARLNHLLNQRILYMRRKVEEFSAG